VKKVGVLVLFLLFALPAAAAPPRKLAYQDAWPVWSPDGTKIAFTRLHIPRSLAELEVVDLRTRHLTKLAQANYQLAPSWSPDGSRIAYQANGYVYVTDLSGAKHRVGKGLAPAYGDSLARLLGTDLYVDGRVWARKVIGRPAWSPDRKQLAFQRSDGIHVTDGKTETRLGVPASGGEPGTPAWSADGTRLAWAQGDGLWIGELARGSVTKIGPQIHQLADPAWEPDGQSLIAMTWLGVVRFFLDGRTQTLHSPSGTGVSVSPSGRLAYVGRRPQCPGHFGIVAGATALSGTCTITGTAAADVIEGTGDPGDVILAGAGNDKVHANDRHTDRIDCGAGRDEVWADRSDRLAHCEIVHR
jgi:dipeptidyl aminopeptidase/acylaminoacyl peptidase